MTGQPFGNGVQIEILFGLASSRKRDAGARSIVLAAMLPADATGGFYRDGKRIPW